MKRTLAPTMRPTTIPQSPSERAEVIADIFLLQAITKNFKDTSERELVGIYF